MDNNAVDMTKLIRLSKKIILLVLMIAVPINSFAAVSVSDGSAFVSKSEFSSTINNLSNRVSTIENTLDAKIDSLVSSYLSRNGIWNGEKQTSTREYILDMCGRNINGATFTYNSSLPNMTNAGIETVIVDRDYTLINSCSKTGLMLAVVEVFNEGRRYASTQSDKRAVMYITAADYGNNTVITSTNEFSFNIGSVQKANVDAVSWTVEPVNNAIGVVWHINPGVFNLYFFVSKLDKVNFKYKLGLIPMSASAYQNLSGKTFNLVGYPGVKIIFKEFSIY